MAGEMSRVWVEAVKLGFFSPGRGLDHGQTLEVLPEMKERLDRLRPPRTEPQGDDRKR